MNQQLCNPTADIATLVPAVVPHEDENGVRLEVALPGVRKEDLKLTLHQSNLEIEATRSNSLPEPWSVRSGGNHPLRYKLHAKLTERLDGQSIQANLDNGVLTVVIPFSEAAKPREILVG